MALCFFRCHLKYEVLYATIASERILNGQSVTVCNIFRLSRYGQVPGTCEYGYETWGSRKGKTLTSKATTGF